MSTDGLARPASVDAESTRRYFTIASANRALRLVRKVADDIVHVFADLIRLRDERQSLVTNKVSEERMRDLRQRIEQCVARLNALEEELDEIGCKLKDWSAGLVDFPALHAGRPVWLCWRPGEDAITHWHEWDENFTGRKTIDATFESDPA